MKYKEWMLTLFSHNKEILSDSVRRELVGFLYNEMPGIIAAEVVLALFAAAFFLSVFSPMVILGWLLYLLIFSTLGRVLIAYYYKKYPHTLSTNAWVRVYGVGVVFSAIAWSIMGGFLIGAHGLVYQTFIIFVLIGVTSSANTMYSANRGIYALFLIIVSMPVTIWVFNKGGLYNFIGAGAIIYVLTMLLLSSNNYALLKNSITLRFKNSDLDYLNHRLEEEVNLRTNDLKNSMAIIESTLESIDYGLIVLNLENKVSFYNNQFLFMWDLEPLPLNTPMRTQEMSLLVEKLVNPEKYPHGIYEARRNPDELFHDELTLKDGRIYERFCKPHRLEGRLIGHVWGYRDISLRKELEESIVHQAHHDSLTNLPNRSVLSDRIEHDIEIAKRFQSQLAIMFVDLDHFKEINDALGHHKGDILLQALAKRLESCVRKSDTVVRFGGDEFIILFITNNYQELTALCNKILLEISKPVKIDNEEIHTTASLGLCMYPQDGLDSATLIKNADMAMYLAKKTGRNHYQIYNDLISLKAKRHRDIQQQLVNAVNRDEFSLVYQPIVSMHNHAIIAAEVLLRWDSPVLGLVLPNEFISISEEMGIIIALSQWVLFEACKQNKQWQDAGGPLIQIAVNISSIQLKRGNLVDVVKRVLSETGLKPEYLILEITETSLVEHSKNIVRMLDQIRELGVEISIDDFGTGYSSFRYLTEFPATILKIDKSLIHNCEERPKYSSIIKAITTMSHQLNLRVLAEGVETEKQYEIVKESGCDEIQGYYISRSLEASDLYALLVSKNGKVF